MLSLKIAEKIAPFFSGHAYSQIFNLQFFWANVEKRSKYIFIFANKFGLNFQKKICPKRSLKSTFSAILCQSSDKETLVSML
jgi:hypothetical protein